MTLTIGAVEAVDMIIPQGTTYSVTVTVRDSANALVDLTGYIARLHVRSKVTATTTLTTRTSAGGTITLGGIAGTVAVVWTAAETAAFTWTRGVYDLEIESAGGLVRRILKGAVTVEPEVTR